MDSFKLILNAIVIFLLTAQRAQSKHGSSACPSLNTEISELTPVDTVIFSFVTDAANVILAPSPGAPEGFLELRTSAPETYDVILVKGVNLNVLNPRPPPVLDTEEQLDCPITTPSPAVNKPLVSALQYTLKCTVTFSYTTVQVQSGVRVAIQDVNNNPPYFLCAPYHKTVSELTPVSTTIFTLKGLAADDDLYGGISGYGLVSDGSGAFGLSGASSQGYIVVDDVLDYDNGPRQYSLNISTTDIGDPPLMNWTLLYITIEDGDDQNPVFEQNMYSLKIQEQRDDLVGTSVLTSPPIYAYDLDFGINETIGYKLVTDETTSEKEYFSINESTGAIEILQKYDILIQNQYVLQVKAYQLNAEYNRFTFATLIIDIEDVNNHKPELKQTSYNVILPENPPVHYSLVDIEATDLDLGANSELSYYVIDPGGALDIDPLSGSLFVTDPVLLDRERNEIYTVKVYAEETSTAEHFRSEEAVVTLTLTDVNDNTPVFDLSHYEFSVSDIQPVGSPVGKVSASDADFGANAELQYHVVYASLGVDTLFALDPVTGIITVRGNLTADPHRMFYTLYIKAEDQPIDSSQTRSGYTTVDISIIPVHNNPPVLGSSNYVIDVSEAVLPGTSVLMIQASDPDGDSLVYSLDGDKEAIRYFEVNAISGVVYTVEPLDHETSEKFMFWINVTDKTYTAHCQVNVTVTDVNDNHPVFYHNNFTFMLTEEQPAGTQIGQIRVSDADSGQNGQVVLRLLGSWATLYVQLDGETGVLTTTMPLDREQVPWIQFMVIAHDLGIPNLSSVAMVTVNLNDINDNAPQIADDDAVIVLPESSIPGFIYQVEAVDPDQSINSIIQYTLIQNDPTLFDINHDTGEISSIVSLDLEESHTQEYHLVVMAYNTVPYDADLENDTFSLYIRIQDKNDKVPVFSQAVYQYTVMEDTPIWASIGRVTARDADYSAINRQIHYWIDFSEISTSEMFMVEEFTGVIRLLRYLDTDLPDDITNYTLRVYASDIVPLSITDLKYNASALVNIIVKDVNDNKPRFTQDLYQLSVPENMATGSPVISVEAYDPDLGSNGHLNFDILAADVPFVLEDNVLKLHGGLNADTGPDHYRVTIIVRDNGVPMLTGSATVDISVLNVNNHAPEFNQSTYTFFIPEALPVGSTVGIVSATDGDFDILQYDVSEQYQDIFTVNSRGELRTNLILDYEEVASYTFIVMATELLTRDGSQFTDPHQTSVEVIVMVTDVNDNAPIFSQENYYITMEEGLSNQIILQVTATDADSGSNGVISYSLLEGENSDYFYIDPENGSLEVLNGSELDYSIQNSFILNVMATDGGTPSMNSLAVVTVEMIDINNNAPMFSQPLYEASIEENHLAEYFVYQVTATDKDVLDELQYNIESPTIAPFYVDPQNGMIFTTDVLDAELKDSYTLNISVTDGLHKSYTKVKINVIDTNDNAPKFAVNNITRDISVDTPIGQEILRAHAVDVDKGMNGFVTHWIIGGDGKFHLDPFSGVLTLSGSLSGWDVKDSYLLTVYAKDHGSVPQVSNMSILLHVSKNNFHAPEFTDFVYQLTIPEDMTSDTLLLQINVTDQDQGVAGEVTLTLSEPTLHPFKIDQQGRLYLSGELDYETQEYYSLEVIATDDASDSRSSVNTVRITVLDVNDNKPHFLPLPSHVYLPFMAGSSQLVTQVVAKDKDSSIHGNNLVGYQLLVGFEICMIDPTSGEIYTRPEIQPGTYTLRIQAYDNGSPSLTNTTSIDLTIMNGVTGLEYPVFSQQVYYASYNESWQPPQQVINVMASFSDVSQDYALHYQITAGNDDEMFTISPYMGVIKAVKQFDRELTDIYTLVVTAIRTDNSKYQSQALVIITVEDSNDEVPHFPFVLYTAKVLENAQAGTDFITLSAIDPDLRGQLEYYLLSYLEDYEDYFYLSEHQGHATIAIAQPVDRETMPYMINLFVGVSDGPNAGSPALVEVKIMDVNDNDPQFEVSQYNFTVYENLGLCAEIGQVLAVDDDSTDAHKLVYSLHSGFFQELSLDPHTGLLSVNCTGPGLDREIRDLYQIQVAVHDSGSRMGLCDVIIHVLDVNDNAPAFVEDPYVFRITEGAPSLDLVMAILVVDLDAGENAEISFTLEQNFQNYFNIRSIKQSGEQVVKVSVEVLKPLDREAPWLNMVNDSAVVTYELKAVDHGQPALSSTILVTIYIEDQNDNPPVFLKPLYEVSVSEGTPVMTSLLTVTATDPDIENGELYYTLHGAEGILSIDPNSGVIRISGQLDIAGTPVLALIVSVSDGKYSSSANIKVTILDTNNHIPVFSRDVYYFSVYENDHQLSTQSNSQVTKQRKGNNTSVGQVIGKVIAADADLGENGEVTYNVTSRNARGLFVIPEPSVGELTLIGILDREQINHYTVIVTATDNGQPRHMSTCEVEIEVLDQNDNIPEFEFMSYTGHIKEMSPSGTTVSMYPDIRVSDRDTGINAEVHFQLAGTNSELFSIEPDLGLITVSELGGKLLDREVKDKYFLQVLAADRYGTPLSLTGTAALTVIIDDVNDNPPTFDQDHYNINVSEALSSGVVIGAFLAHDRDLSPNNRLQYSIIGGADGRFWMDRVTGELYITGGLDRELQPFYTLNISVTDTGVDPAPLETFTTIDITVDDYNDNPPISSDGDFIKFTVDEELQPPVLAGVVPFTDADTGANGEVTCEIVGSVPFAINATTGELFTTQIFDRETTSKYTFQVIARDHGYPVLTSEVTVTISVMDVNDHSPRFNQPEYTVSIIERSPVGAVVMLPIATDPDLGRNGNITFGMHSVNGAEKYFEMDPLNGLIQVSGVIDVVQLTREGIIEPDSSQPVITLTLYASDHGEPPKQTQADLSVYIESFQSGSFLTFDKNTYYLTIEEGLGPDFQVLSVTATASNSRTRVTYSVIGTQYFEIKTPSQGDIVTTQQKIDYEMHRNIIFTVRAASDSNTQTVAFAMVSVNILDVNDNKPVFEQTEYDFTIEEGIILEPVIIGKVKATDDDSGDNARLEYFILDDHNIGYPFDINHQSGEILLTSSLDREQNMQHTLMIQAKDHGTPAQTSVVTVVISVTDINDNAPILDSPLYEVNVSNRAAPGETILEFEAVDYDEGLSGTVFYQLDYDKLHNVPFYVQNKAGKGLLKTSSRLVFDSEKLFDLQLVAYDLGTPRLSTTARVKVTIMNDLALMPNFDRDVYEIVISSESSTNTTIFVCSAGDVDFDYSIIGGNEGGYFEISPHACVVSVRSLLPHTRSMFTLMLFVHDAGIPPNTAMARLVITVEPGPRLPVFPEPMIEVTIMENEPDPVLVVDLDTSEELAGLQVIYNWMDNIYSGMFYLEEDTGKIWTADVLDREKLDMYTLVVRCNLVHGNRNKRNADIPSNIVEIVITVGDLNDNPPQFEADLYVFGIPEDTTYNSMVATVQATDRDAGNNSVLVYSISGGDDRDKFRIDPTQGQIYSKVKVDDFEKESYSLEVVACDDWGQGIRTTATVMFQVLSNIYRVVLVARVPPSVFQEYMDNIIGNLSNILDVDIKIEKIEPHLAEKDGTVNVDESRSDLYFYAVDYSTGTVMPRDELLRRIDEHDEEITALFKQYGIERIGPATVSTVTGNMTIGPTEGALIALGALVVLGSIIGVACICVTWKTKKQNKTHNGIVPIYNGAIHAHNGTIPRHNGNGALSAHNGLPNLGYYGSSNDVFRETLDIDNVLIHDSTFKPMETQRLSIYLPDEGQVSDGSTQSSLYSSSLGEKQTGSQGSIYHPVQNRNPQHFTDPRVESIRDRRNRIVNGHQQMFQCSSSSPRYKFCDTSSVNEASVGATIIKEYYFADTPVSNNLEQGIAHADWKVPNGILQHIPHYTDSSGMMPHEVNDGNLDMQRVEYCEQSLFLTNSPVHGKDASLVSALDTIKEDSEGQTDLSSSGQSSLISLKQDAIGSDTRQTHVPHNKSRISNLVLPVLSPLIPAEANQHMIGKTNSLPHIRYILHGVNDTATSPCFSKEFFTAPSYDPSKEKSFTTFGKNLEKKNAQSLNAASLATKKSLRFSRVSPLINPIKRCVEGNGDSKGDRPTLVKNSEVASPSEYLNCETRQKKKTWPGCGKVVTFHDCLVVQQDENKYTKDQANYTKLKEGTPNDRNYEEAETKF